MEVVDFLGIELWSVVHRLSFRIVEIIKTVRDTASAIRAIRLFILSSLLESESFDSPNSREVDLFGNLREFYRSRLLRPLA